MNRLSHDERAKVLQLLCEGMAIRAVARVTGVQKNTIIKLLNDAGRALGAYQDAIFFNLPCKRVQVDEIWSFTYCKQRTVATAKAAPIESGDAWTWTAICADTKLVFSVLVGDRDAYFANAFMQDVAARVRSRVQLSSDGHKSYLRAVEGAFGVDVDYGQLVKQYGPAPGPPGRYSPAVCTGARRVTIEGIPDPKHISTSYVERQNLTMRMHMRRFTRLTNAFSKKLENHANAIALHFAYYNFVRVHQTLRITPAMAAGVTHRLWDMSDLVAIVAAADAKPRRPKTYNKRKAA
jgi:IS1 family transposase